MLSVHGDFKSARESARGAVFSKAVAGICMDGYQKHMTQVLHL